MYQSMIPYTAGFDCLAESFLSSLRFGLGLYCLLMITILAVAAVVRALIVVGQNRPQRSKIMSAGYRGMGPYPPNYLVGESSQEIKPFNLLKLLS